MSPDLNTLSRSYKLDLWLPGRWAGPTFIVLHKDKRYRLKIIYCFKDYGI